MSINGPAFFTKSSVALCDTVWYHLLGYSVVIFFNIVFGIILELLFCDALCENIVTIGRGISVTEEVMSGYRLIGQEEPDPEVGCLVRDSHVDINILRRFFHDDALTAVNHVYCQCLNIMEVLQEF